MSILITGNHGFIGCWLNLYLKETTERYLLEKENLKKLSFKIQRSPGKGRPTKKERRKIDDFDKKN